MRVLNTFDESVLLITKRNFFKIVRPALIRIVRSTEFQYAYQIFLGELLDGVDSVTTASKCESFHISSLSSSKSNNAFLCERVQTERIDTLLVNNNEVLVSAFTDFLLEVDNLLAAFISESSLARRKLFSLFSIGVEEAAVDFSLFVLERDIASQDVTVLQFGWHIRVSATMIKDKSSDESSLIAHFVYNVHDLNHEEINWLLWLTNNVHSIDDFINQPKNGNG